MGGASALFYIRVRKPDGSKHRIGAVRIKETSDGYVAGLSLCHESDTFDAELAVARIGVKNRWIKYADAELTGKRATIDWTDAYVLLRQFHCTALNKRLTLDDYSLNADYLAGALKHIGLREKKTK